MKRRVARIGPSTLMVSLPSKWCKERNLHKGDEIEVNLGENNSLVIGAEQPEKKLKEITIDLSKFRYYPRHLVATAYKTGYDKVIAKYSSEKEKKDAENLFGYSCLGYTVLEETKDTFVIKDLAGINEKEFGAVLRKLFFLYTEVAGNALEFVKTGNRDKLAELISNRRTSNKYTDYCRRIINKNLPINYKYPAIIFYLLEQMETITKTYQNLSLFVANIQTEGISLPSGFYLPAKLKVKKVGPRIIHFLEKTNQRTVMLPTLFYSPTIEKVDFFSRDIIQLIYEFNKEILFCKKGEEALEWSFILLILDALRELRGSPLLSLNF